MEQTKEETIIVQNKLKEILVEMGHEDSKLFENPNFSTAVTGITIDGIVVYDYELMIEFLLMNQGMTYDEALDFIHHNTIGILANMGDKKPVIMKSIDYVEFEESLKNNNKKK